MRPVIITAANPASTGPNSSNHQRRRRNARYFRISTRPSASGIYMAFPFTVRVPPDCFRFEAQYQQRDPLRKHFLSRTLQLEKWQPARDVFFNASHSFGGARGGLRFEPPPSLPLRSV